MVGAGVLFGAGTIRLPMGRSGVSWGVQNRPGLLEGVRNACPNSIWNQEGRANLANPNVNLKWLAMCPSQKQGGKKEARAADLKTNGMVSLKIFRSASIKRTYGSELLSRGVAPIFSFFMSSMAPAVVGGIPMGGRLNGTPLATPTLVGIHHHCLSAILPSIIASPNCLDHAQSIICTSVARVSWR